MNEQQIIKIINDKCIYTEKLNKNNAYEYIIAPLKGYLEKYILGSEKIVLFFKNYSKVIKISIFENEKINTSSLNKEYIFYNFLKTINLNNLFLENILLDKTKYEIYAQEKIITCQEMHIINKNKIQPTKDELLIISNIKNKIFEKIINWNDIEQKMNIIHNKEYFYIWMNNILIYYKEDFFYNFLSFLSIFYICCDFSNNNIGYTINKKPIIIDYTPHYLLN